MKTEQASESSRLLASQYAGSDRWWLEITRRGTPLIEPLANGRCKVTFLWRDPQRGVATSALQRVWIQINSLTDHHHPAPPQSLQQLNDSDIWYWQTELNADWRGSYCFIPTDDDHSPAIHHTDSHINMHNVRHWWLQVSTNAIPDLLNPLRAWKNANGRFLSGLHMPQAPRQPAWQNLDNYDVANGCGPPAAPAKLQRHLWHSQRLGNTRHVWVYSTGESKPASRPLAILLDGQFWAKQMPVWDPLMRLTAEKKLPEAVYLLIDVIDQKHRAQELTCNGEFWLAVQEELLPQLAHRAPHSSDATSTIVAGQSFGGLSALYAALRWPACFGAVISQSGSFWWPRRDMLHVQKIPDDACWLIHQIEDRQLGVQGKVKVFIEAGVHEKLIHFVSDRTVAILRERGHQVQYRIIAGGHDALCWRGGLLEGLQAHWSGEFDDNDKGASYGHSEPV